jgi:hypothetical protein
LPNANAQTQSTRVVEDVIASSPTPPPTPYTPEPPQKPFVQPPPDILVPKLVPKPAQPVVDNVKPPDKLPSPPTIKAGDPVPGKPGLIYNGASTRLVDDNGDPYGDPIYATTTPEAYDRFVAAWNAPGGGGSIAAANAARDTARVRVLTDPTNRLINPPKVIDVEVGANNTYGVDTSSPTNAVKIVATLRLSDGTVRRQTLDEIDAGSTSVVTGDGFKGLDGKVVDYNYDAAGNLTYKVRDIPTPPPPTNTAPLGTISAPTTVEVNDNTSISLNAGSSYAGATLNLITTVQDNTKITQPVVADSSGNINIAGVNTSQPGNINISFISNNGNTVSKDITVNPEPNPFAGDVLGGGNF